jgi:16S rRNA (cytosine967-C5)-methyltransferase
MTPGARVAAAIEVLGAIASQRRPAQEVLKDWGVAHRFAGSRDRAAIASLVYDALRVRASAAWIMGDDGPRATLIGALRRLRDLDGESAAALFSGEGHAPAPLSEEETARLAANDLSGAPAHVRGDYPEWLAGAFDAVFGDAAVEEGRALAQRAPIDLRVNTLRVSRDKALGELAHLHPELTRLSPAGLRLGIGPDGRGPALHAEPALARGWIEVQDEGSQLAALLAGAQPGMQALDLCAGGGGKTLALAAAMQNKGQIFATDADGRRLTPIYARLERAGAHNVQVRAPRGGKVNLGDLKARCDVVFVDAPCTGTGVWRRNPDAKWRTRPGALEQRMKQQDEVLDQASQYVKPSGIILYATCSILKAENEDRVGAFLERNAEFLPLEAAHLARRAGLPELAQFASAHGPGLRLTPRAAGTDGFYICGLLRA